MEAWMVWAVLLVGGGLYLLGSMLIHAYFTRKAEFVDDLHEKMKGSTDGQGQ